MREGIVEQMAEQITNQMKEIVARNPFAGHIGMELLEAAEGYARARVRLDPQFENVYGNMHGGCAYSLADTLAGIAACSYGELVTTLSAAVNYMRPITGTEYLYAAARVKRNGRSISVVSVELTDDGGKLLMDASFNFYHIKEHKPNKE